ncbi:MAG: aspartate 1-decarboxylase [Candidatus Neomarinimicrobiota bacterium]
MYRTLLKSKLHRATVTGADLEYEGSISIDPELLRAADILPYEQVDVYDITNGARLTTYAIVGKPGEVCLNGAAARLVVVGDQIIVACYSEYEAAEWPGHKPIKLLLNKSNSIVEWIVDD